MKRLAGSFNRRRTGSTCWTASPYGGKTLLLVLTATAASWTPALRATRVDPVEMLRA